LSVRSRKISDGAFDPEETLAASLADDHFAAKPPVAAQSGAASVRPTALVHEARNKFPAAGTM